MYRRVLAIAILMAGVASGQSFTAARVQGASVEQNADATNGGYLVWRPMTYNPGGGSVCHDQWTNAVQQPTPASSGVTFGPDDAVMWYSASPSMPFATGSGLVQPMQYNTATASGPCGTPLNVNTLIGLNTNVYFFARGGLATDNTFYNSISSLQGGVTANSFTAAVWYPVGTTICTSYNGASCASTAVIASGVCPGGSVGCYLGGHVDVGHSVGPPASGGIGAVSNPYSDGEGPVAGQLYFEDGSGVYPTYLPCLRVHNGSSFGCTGDVSEVYNSFADRAPVPSATAAFQTSTGTMTIWGSGDFQGQSYKATGVFNSLADLAGSPSTTAAFQTSTGTMVCFGSGDCQAQSFALTHAVTAESLTSSRTVNGLITAGSANIGTGVTGATVALNVGGGSANITGAGDLNAQSATLTHAVTAESLTSSRMVNGLVTAGSANIGTGVTGATVALNIGGGTSNITGAGEFSAQSVALTNGITVGSGAYGLSASGVLTASSCSICGVTYTSGIGVGISGGVISIGQAVATTSGVSFATVFTSSTISSTGTIFALGDLSVSGVAAIATGIIDAGYLTVSGSIVAGGNTGVSCSGAPSPSFATTNGVVTHC